MAVYVTRLFDKKFRNERLTDSELLRIANDVIAGRYEGNLGGGVIKKRIALLSGKRSGARTIIFFKIGAHLFFADGWKKNQVSKGRKEIEDDVLASWKDIANDLFKLNPQQLERLKQAKQLREVQSDDGAS